MEPFRDLGDEQWARVAPLQAGQRASGGRYACRAQRRAGGDVHPLGMGEGASAVCARCTVSPALLAVARFRGAVVDALAGSRIRSSGDFQVANQMAKKETSAAYQALLAFSDLEEHNRQHFISGMNTFLLSAPQSRRHLVEQWKQHHERLTGGKVQAAAEAPQK
nr:hypothetical protein [Paraburkholderia nemoris]